MGAQYSIRLAQIRSALSGWSSVSSETEWVNVSCPTGQNGASSCTRTPQCSAYIIRRMMRLASSSLRPSGRRASGPPSASTGSLSSRVGAWRWKKRPV